MLTPTTGGGTHVATQYDVSLYFLHARGLRGIPTVAACAANLAPQGIQALIGRDVLQLCLLVYDGANGAFTLAY